MFEHFRSEEPAPTRDRPGFKEPRKIKVEYLSVSPEMPYFKELARTMVLVPPAVWRVTGPLDALVGGAALPWAVNAIR